MSSISGDFSLSRPSYENLERAVIGAASGHKFTERTGENSPLTDYCWAQLERNIGDMNRGELADLKEDFAVGIVHVMTDTKIHDKAINVLLNKDTSGFMSKVLDQLIGKPLTKDESQFLHTLKQTANAEMKSKIQEILRPSEETVQNTIQNMGNKINAEIPKLREAFPNLKFSEFKMEDSKQSIMDRIDTPNDFVFRKPENFKPKEPSLSLTYREESGVIRHRRVMFDGEKFSINGKSLFKFFENLVK